MLPKCFALPFISLSFDLLFSIPFQAQLDTLPCSARLFFSSFYIAWARFINSVSISVFTRIRHFPAVPSFAMHISQLLVLFPALALAAVVPPSTSQNETVPPTTNRGPADGAANNAQLIQSLLLAPKAVDRIGLLSEDTDFKFDFLNPPPKSTSSENGKGGRTVRADRVSFPALIGANAATTVGFLGPCGFNTPHTHPRSAELNLVIQGRLVSQFVLENGARTVTNTVENMQMTVFPLGALHTEFNPDCEPATFVAGFASEDPGVQQEAQAFFGLEEDIVRAAVGNDFAFEGKDVAKFRAMIPENVALGVESCLKKCGISPAS